MPGKAFKINLPKAKLADLRWAVGQPDAEAWGLPYLGHAADSGTTLITRPWK